MPQSLSYLWGVASPQHCVMTSVTLPRITAAQAASCVGSCQTLPPQAVLVALTDVVVVDISGVVVDGGLCLCLNSQEKGEGRRLKKKKQDMSRINGQVRQ